MRLAATCRSAERQYSLRHARYTSTAPTTSRRNSSKSDPNTTGRQPMRVQMKLNQLMTS
jgi:hypothetical protein